MYALGTCSLLNRLAPREADRLERHQAKRKAGQMRLCKYAALAVVAVGLGVGAVGVPAWADAPGMQWKSPAKITTGVPFRAVAIAKCPAPPTPGDTVLVQVTLSLGAGGSANDVAPARSDGSWSAT